MKQKTLKILLAVTTSLLICVLVVQGMYAAGVFKREESDKYELKVDEQKKTTESEKKEPKKNDGSGKNEEPKKPDGSKKNEEPDKPHGDKPEKDENEEQASNGTLHREGYTLEQVVILSRHNIRSPLSGKGSVLDTLTPYDWFAWSSNPSQLSVRGGVLETEMGQYFRKWLESEGLFPENYHPESGEVRIYANSKQRTLATAKFFSAGLLPSADSEIEHHGEFDKMDPVFTPQITFMTEEYRKDAIEGIKEQFKDVLESLSENYKLLEDVIDIKNSQDWKDGNTTGFKTGDSEFTLEENAEPGVKGSLKTACSVSDALVLQYYEADDAAAAFGKELTFEQWKAISKVKDVYGDVLFTLPDIAVNVANPLLKEIKSELGNDKRKFTFLCGHDSNVGSVLAALSVEEYDLPNAIECKTPIGCKLVFSRFSDADGKKFISVDLVYQSPEQLRGLSLLDLNEQPMIYNLSFTDLEKNKDGLYPAEEIEKRISEAIGRFDELKDIYALADAA